MGYTVVPLSARTGKQLKRRPRKGQKVILAIRGPRGSIRPLSKNPQEYLKKDIDGLNKQLSKVEGGNFIVQEQITRKAQRDKKNKIIRRKDGKARLATKITFPQPRRKQKPLLFVKGKLKRDLGIGYQKGHYKKALAAKKLLLASTKKKALPVNIVLKGSTIKEALSALQVDVSFAEIKKAGKDKILYYSVLLKVVDPSGKVTWIPATGSSIPQDFNPNLKTVAMIEGKRRTMAKKGLEKASNLHSRLAHSIRLALFSGKFRYTRPEVLEKIELKEDRIISKMIKQKAPDDVVEIYENVRDKIKRPPYYVSKAQVMGTKPGLKQITGNYNITAYIKFEIGAKVI